MRAFLFVMLLALVVSACYLYYEGWWERAAPEPSPEIQAAPGPGLKHSSATASSAKASTDIRTDKLTGAVFIKDTGQKKVQKKTLNRLDEQPDKIIFPEPSASPAAKAFREGVEAFNDGEYKEAIRHFNEAPDDEGVLRVMGVSYFKLGDYGNAERYLEKSVAGTGEDFHSLKYLSYVYYEQDRLDKCLDKAEAALRMRDDMGLRQFYERVKKERTAHEGFLSEETSHFRVLFDGYAHGYIDRKILEILEDAYRTIGAEMDYFPDSFITVILYAEKDFDEVLGRLGKPGWADGWYDGKIRIPIRGIREENEAILRQVLFHEYVHALVHSITPNCPMWVNEGLAEYFSEDRPEQVGQVIPLRTLEREFPMQGGRATNTAYEESHAAVDYLVERYGIYNLKQFLLNLSSGQHLDEAFSSAFITSYEEFVSTWGMDSRAER